MEQRERLSSTVTIIRAAEARKSDDTLVMPNIERAEVTKEELYQRLLANYSDIDTHRSDIIEQELGLACRALIYVAIHCGRSKVMLEAACYHHELEDQTIAVNNLTDHLVNLGYEPIVTPLHKDYPDEVMDVYDLPVPEDGFRISIDLATKNTLI